MQLDRKVCVITGAAQGLGRAMARQFVDEGAAVVVADINDETGRATAAELGDAASYVQMDVAQPAGWYHTMAAVRSTHGRLDVLVNCAGLLHFGMLVDTSFEDYLKVVGVNQHGAFLGMHHGAPLLRDSGGGSIINVGSITGLGGTVGTMPRNAAYWAVRGMTRCAALELAQWNIRVNSLIAGSFDTPHIAPMEQPNVAGSLDLMTRTVPLGRRLGTPEEFARMALFLASDAASFSTGCDFVIDGGKTAMLASSNVAW